MKLIVQILLNLVQIWYINCVTVNIPLTNYGNAQYYANIDIGNPATTFKVAIDTTSPITFVPSADCDLTQLACKLHSRYASFNSSSYVGDGSTWSCPHAPTDVTGYLSVDKVKIGNLTVQYQTIAEAVNLNSSTLVSSKYDGVLGLSLPSSSIPKNIVENLADNRDINANGFGLWLNRNPNDQNGGELTLGGYDESKFKRPFYTLPLSGSSKDLSTDWAIQLDTIVSNTYQQIGCIAYVTPGQPTISLPLYDADQLHRYLGGTPISSGQYSFDCTTLDTLIAVQLNFGSSSFSLTHNDYVSIVDTPFGRYCLSLFEGISDSNFCYIGSPFLGRYYSYFDAENKTISFAEVV